jgi:hypothetical protein
MRRLRIYRRGTDSEVRASERSPLWQGMGHSPPCRPVASRKFGVTTSAVGALYARWSFLPVEVEF